jgi:hypothetical protein
MAALFESNFPGHPDSNYEASFVGIYEASGTDDGQPVGVDIAVYHDGNGAVVPDADIPRLITALYAYLASRGLPALPAIVDEQTQALWRTSQNDRMIINLAGEIQDAADKLREAAGLPEIG